MRKSIFFADYYYVAFYGDRDMKMGHSIVRAILNIFNKNRPITKEGKN